MKKYLIIFFNLIFFYIYPEIKNIPDQYIIFEKANSGYDLYIKKIDGIESILLTESQKDPQFKKTNYGLRTPVFHPCNGNEIRILDNKILQTKYDVFFLIDSTVENHGVLGESFHFFLPEIVLYGYSWTRNGEIRIEPGVEINLRLFEKKYGDYTGSFKDQWIILNLKINKEIYNERVIENFEEISNRTNSKIIIIKKEDNLEKKIIDSIVDNIDNNNDTDIVFIIDTTLSMKEEMPVFKNKFTEIYKMITEKVKNPRIAFIFYRDYGDLFLNRIYDFTEDLNQVMFIVKNIQIDGGEDVPEAIYEAISEIKNLTFKSNNRIAFLFGDAPAHPTPRGNITKDDAFKIMEDFNIKIYSVCFPVK